MQSFGKAPRAFGHMNTPLTNNRSGAFHKKGGPMLVEHALKRPVDKNVD